MRILFVTHFFPYPPTDGGHLGYFNPIKYLSRSNEIILVSMIDPTEKQYIPEMSRYCAAIETYERKPKLDAFRLIRGLFQGPPGSAAKYFYAGFGQVVADCVSRYSVDLVEFEHLNTAAYRGSVGDVPAILREHNVEHVIWQRHADSARNPVEKAYVTSCARRLRAYEARMVNQFSCCLTVSQADAVHLGAICPRARIEPVPSGVDTEYFYPSRDVEEQPYRMVFTGAFNWRPRQHNLRVILTDIMPRIRAKVPQVQLDIVGKGIPEDLRKLAERTPGVTVTGEVPDVRPYVWRSSVALNYVESGGGIALKVLEAMAMRKPVLSNPLGCEGIEVEHGQEVFLAEGAEQFASAAALLLINKPMRTTLAENGYRKATTQYSWTVIVGRLMELYERSIRGTVRREREHAREQQTSGHTAD